MALKRALEFCQGQWVITMDDDLQHPPSELPKLIDATQNHNDVDVIMGAYGARRAQLHKSIGASRDSNLNRETKTCWLSGRTTEIC